MLFNLKALSRITVQCALHTVFCPGFQKGRVPSEKGTFAW